MDKIEELSKHWKDINNTNMYKFRELPLKDMDDEGADRIRRNQEGNWLL